MLNPMFPVPHLHSTMYLLNHICTPYNVRYYLDLHSTMYLLNRTCKFSPNASNVFTFHYVSIKSHPVRQELNILRKFTFHYVSIKSDTGTDIETVTQKFTFHYVSIKSILGESRGKCVKIIYIPLCIY